MDIVPTDRQPCAVECRFHVGDRELAEVKNACRQHSVGSRLNRTREIVDDPRPTARNQGNVDVASDELDEFGVESLGCPVRVHRIQQDLTCTALRRLVGPCDRVHSRATPTTVGGHLESTRGRDVADTSPRINTENNALRTKALACLGDERRIGDRGRIDADLVRPCPQETIEVLDRSDTTTDSERNEDALCGALNNVVRRFPARL